MAALADVFFSAPVQRRLWTRHARGNGLAAGLMRKLGFEPMPAVADDPAPVRRQVERGRWAARRDASFAPPPATCYIRKGCIGQIGMAAWNGSLSWWGMRSMHGAHHGPPPPA